MEPLSKLLESPEMSEDSSSCIAETQPHLREKEEGQPNQSHDSGEEEKAQESQTFSGSRQGLREEDGRWSRHLDVKASSGYLPRAWTRNPGERLISEGGGWSVWDKRHSEAELETLFLLFPSVM